MKLEKAIKIHMVKEDGISLCGQAPWSKEVEYFDGTIEEIDCRGCLMSIKKGE